MPLGAITTVASHRKFTNGVLEVTVAGNREKWLMTSASHTEQVSATIRRVVHEANAAASQPPAAAPTEQSATDHVTQLRQLAELRDAGIISVDDFEAKKNEILSRM